MFKHIEPLYNPICLHQTLDDKFLCDYEGAKEAVIRRQQRETVGVRSADSDNHVNADRD